MNTMMLTRPEGLGVMGLDGGERLDFPWGHITWLVSGSLENSETMTFGRVCLLAYHENPRHRHPNCDEILHVLSGRLEHSLGDDLVELKAGDTLHIPRGAWHHARVVGTEDAELVICFSTADRMTEMEEAEQP